MSENRPCKTVAIAGAGLLGRLFAWRLSQAGHRVSLFEKCSEHDNQSAAWTAAAMISPMSEVVVSDKSIFDLGMQSLTLWESWLSDAPAFLQHYTRKGSIVLAHPNDDAEIHQFYRELQFHLGEHNNSRWLTQNELLEMEPDISTEFQHGLYLPDEAHIDNRALLDQLLQKMAGEVNVNWNSDIQIEPALCVNGSPLKGFDTLIDCRGIGATGSTLNVRGVRGEVIHVETPEVKLNRPIRLMHPRYKLYLVPKPQQRFIIGATELESSDTSPMSVQSALELCSALYSINPAFAEARILEMDTNLRPALQNNLPAINKHEIADAKGNAVNVISVNGLYRHGYLIAPALVEDVRLAL